MSDALFRLIGDGDRNQGGAIPLPDAFTVILNELLDHGPADFRRLDHLVSETLAWKEERIMAAAWRSWSRFTADILSVLKEMGLITPASGEWALTEEFIPGRKFFLPGTDIGFVGRTRQDRERQDHNSLLHMALNPVLLVLREKAGNADPRAIESLLRAEEILLRELDLGDPRPGSPYRARNPREPDREGRRLRWGVTDFFREFWVKDAVPGTWYDLPEIGRKFDEANPDQLPVGKNGDLLGGMRKAARDMVAAGTLDIRRVKGDRGWRHQFRLQTGTPDYYPGTILPVRGDEEDPKA